VGHELIDQISLEIGRRVAARLRDEPSLVSLARNNLERWTKLNASAPSLVRCYDEWREILKGPIEVICELLTADTEESRRLRQNSPFVGVLSAREVWEVKNLFHHATPAA
jgi:hypothetical protein